MTLLHCCDWRKTVWKRSIDPLHISVAIVYCTCIPPLMSLRKDDHGNVSKFKRTRTIPLERLLCCCDVFKGKHVSSDHAVRTISNIWPTRAGLQSRGIKLCIGQGCRPKQSARRIVAGASLCRACLVAAPAPPAMPHTFPNYSAHLCRTSLTYTSPPSPPIDVSSPPPASGTR